MSNVQSVQLSWPDGRVSTERVGSGGTGSPVETSEWLKAQGRRAYRAVETGDLSDAADYIAPEWQNREAEAEPPAARQPGPAGFAATVRWLRTAYSELRFVEHTAIVEGDLVVSHVTMHGRQTGPLVLQDGDSIRVLPPTGHRFAHEQVHISRFDAEGRALTHLAVRDDLGLMIQLGHFPPGPAAPWRNLAWWLTGRAATARRAFLDQALE
jgi:SnoaL-like polyketide cyclase